MIISPKTSASPLNFSSPFLDDSAILPPIDLTGPVQYQPLPESIPASESYTILRTLQRTSTSSLYLAHSSESSAGRTSPRLFAIRKHAVPLSYYARIERAALELIALKQSGHLYIQNVHRIWQEDTAVYMVLDHCEGGDLTSYIKNEGPVEVSKMKRWACEIVRAFQHSLLRI